MPITSSAKKALRQSLKRRVGNARVKKTAKEAIKKFRALVLQKSKGEAVKLLPLLQKALDKAVKANMMEKNTASRLKSRLQKSLSKLS